MGTTSRGVHWHKGTKDTNSSDRSKHLHLYNTYVLYAFIAPPFDLTPFIANCVTLAEIPSFTRPAHPAPAEQRYGRIYGELSVTDDPAARLVLTPRWKSMGETVHSCTVDVLTRVLIAQRRHNTMRPYSQPDALRTPPSA